MPKKKKKHYKAVANTIEMDNSKMTDTINETVKETLAQLIDGSAEDFKLHVVGKNLGYVHSLTILLENTYMQLVAIKNNLRDEAHKETDEEKRKELDEAYNHTINEMLKIEEKQTFLIQWEKEIQKRGRPRLTT